MKRADRTFTCPDERPILHAVSATYLLEQCLHIGAVSRSLAKLLREPRPLVGRGIHDDYERLLIEPVATRAHEKIAPKLKLRLAVFLPQPHDAWIAGKQGNRV